MNALCKQVERFSDGEMAPPEAEGFRLHVSACASCQVELAALAQLHVLATRYHAHHGDALVEGAAGVVLLPPRGAARRWRWAAGGALSALAAMLLSFVALWRPDPSHRLADGRSAHPEARQHLPVAQRTLGPPGAGAGTVSHGTFAALERKGDWLGLASARLARGTRRDAEEAIETLAPLEESADVRSELALAHLVRGDVSLGDAEQALRHATRALEIDPRHGPALWNRALALEALGLHRLAATSFDQVAALQERGWKEEASQRARRIRRPVEEARRRWNEALEAGKDLVATGAPPPDRLLGVPVLRRFFLDAVRTRASAEEVQALLPLARRLDAVWGGDALEKRVGWTAARDFGLRAPLAADYRRMSMAGQVVDVARLLRRLKASGEVDLLLGALGQIDVGERNVTVPELRRLAEATREDAWLGMLALRLLAEALEAQGQGRDATEALEGALRSCQEARLDHWCVELELDLTGALIRAGALERAQAHARHGWEAAVRALEWDRQIQLLLKLAQLAQLRQDPWLARAFHEEALERYGDPDPARRRSLHEELALLDLSRMRLDEARRHLDAAIATGSALGLSGALALSDLARLRRSPEADAAAMEAFQLRRMPHLGAGQLALAHHALGRWTIESRPDQGRELLWRAIYLAQAEGLAARDADARRARDSSYALLILEAGKHGDAEDALRLFQEEWLAGAPGALPARCLLAVTADRERTLAIVRPAGGGAPRVFFDAGWMKPLPDHLKGFLPAEVGKSLSGCGEVKVLARAPVHGRPGLLPPELAWSYLGPAARPDGPPGGGARRHLVVQAVDLAPARWPLRAPKPWPSSPNGGERVEQVSQSEATPSLVLRRMAGASDITLITHGLVSGDSQEAFVALSPDEGGDALSASAIQGAQLSSRPLVVLAACEATQPALTMRQAARDLADAFLRAGARAVLAAGEPIPEQDCPAFFGKVRERIRAGASPAAALREERGAWRSADRWAPWLEGVLLFE